MKHLVTIVTFVVVSCLTPFFAWAAEKPNVLFIAIDDLRPELGCYGADHIISPNIDALAASGVRFDRAYCQQAICGPSRASVLTGLRPDSAGVHGNHTHFRSHYPDIVTLPQHFKNNGYHTRAMGKIYHGVFPEGSSKTVADTFGDERSWSVPAFRPGPRYYYTEEGISAAKAVYQQLYKPTDLEPDDWTTKLVFGPATEAPDVPDSTLYDGQVADRAVASLKELSQKPDEPFFLAVGFIKPHSPYIAPKKYWDLYDPAAIDIAGQTDFLEGVPKIALHNSGELRRYTDQAKTGPIPDEVQRRVKHAYYACISYIDAQVGRVLAELDAQGLRDNTIVVLWSDHGYHLGEQNLWGKTTNFELDTRVPLIVRAPGRAGNGQVSDALVELVDLFPSLTDLCGLPQPHGLEGSSFVPLLDTPEIQWKKGAFSQFTRGKLRGYSIRTPMSRYTEWRNTTTQEVTAREFYIYGDEYPLEPPNQADDVPELTQAYSERLAAGHGWKTVRRELNRSSTSGFSIAKVFTDHMVLQRGQQVLVWGTAIPGSSIDLSFGDQKEQTTTGRAGNWQIVLDPLPANATPVDLIVNDQTIRDVLVGDVWLCSGQSNMRWMLKQSQDADAEIQHAADSKNLRLLDLTAEIYPVGRAYDREALRKTTADNYFAWSGWQPATPESAASFSAVAWHFGKRLRELNPEVPVGLIHNSIGGTPMESWIPESTLLADPELQRLVTFPWYAENHPDYPKWCGLRGRQNLANYFASPDGPVPHHPFQPGFLFDAGVSPVSKFPISGILWYQGESNATQDGANSPPINPAWNHRLFLSLISSWREVWQARELPFVFAQLPGLNRNWPLFREMQLETAAADPNVHMAVTIDVGHPTNVHPPNKRPVGRRMAELALAFAASPVTTAIAPESREITFDQLIKSSDGKPIRGFQLAGVDKAFHPATATAIGKTVKVVCDKVSTPVAVRFGWENDPDLNLVGVNGEHPVSPFRSDRWETGEASSPGVTHQAVPRAGFTGFETPRAGILTVAEFDGATWKAPLGHAEVSTKLARTGLRCLHLMGGKHSEVEFALSPKHAGKNYSQLTFAAERWTKRAPFTFRVEASTTNGKWQEIYNGDKAVKVGRPYLNRVVISLPEGAQQFRMTCTSPPGTGVLIDDMNLVEAKPMTVTRVAVLQQTAPVLIGQELSPLLQLEIETEGSLSPRKLSAVEFVLPKGETAIREVHFQGQTVKPGSSLSFEVDLPLQSGTNVFPLTCRLAANASLDEFISASCVSIQLDDKQIIEPNPTASSIRRRIGVAVRQHGDDGVHTYRIPGITTTNDRTLIAVYDNRNQRGGDLPGDIDVGMSRSTDGGQSWEPMKIIMDMGDDPKWSYDGIGDPSILTDRVTGDIWVAATWSHGNRSWHGSGPGKTPEETGQFMLVKSADDGKTWSKPINITPQVKANPQWRFVLDGPGNGITLQDGTLVFPAQFRGEDAEPVNGKPFSTIISSKDRGETWTIGSGVKIDTTEAQIVQLEDGSIMINCRDNRGGSRSVYMTAYLGKTWTEHPTSRKALPEPVCNADILRVVHPKHGPLLFFSNPNTTSGRHHFTMKVSDDEGMTWPAKWHTLYDERPGSGYSTLTQIDDDHIGVLYEGPGELYFLRFSIDELLRSVAS